MNNITAARDISGIAPVSVLRGISPLCVPFASGSGLADEVKRRADPNIVSLWERLGLVYLIEQPAQAPVHKTHVTVNNFTAQLVFRICSQNHTDRLIERYQPGFVFPEKIRAAGAALNSVLRTNEAHRVGEAFTRNSRYTEEISRIFRLVFEKETGGIPLQTVCRALAVLLGSTGGGAVFTAQQQKIFQRIATVLSAEYPESTAAQEIASVGAAAVFTEEQRRRILSAANVMGYNTQHEAAQRVLSLVNSGKTREEIGRVLLTEVRRYGLDGEMQNDVITSARAAVSSSQPESGVITAETESPTEQGNGFVIPVNGVSYEMAKLLLADDFSGDIPSGAISSAAIAESSAAKVLAERLSTVKFDERFNKAFSEEITERLTKFVTCHISGNSAPSTLTDGIAGSHQLSGTVVSLPSVSGEKLVSVTAGTSGRILNQLGSQETQLNLISHNSAESSQFSENVRNTLEIIKQYSGNQVSEYDQSNIYDNADNSDFGVNVSVVQQFSDDRSYSSQGTTEQYLDIQQTEHVDGKRGSAAVPADIHDTQTVLPPERTTEIRSAEQFHTESTTEVPQPGTVLPAERTTEIRSAEQFHTESTTEVPKPGTVLPAERTTEIHSAEQYHTDTVFTPKSEAQAAAGSFRSRLDTRTLETLDRLVAESRGQVKAPDEPQEQPAQMVLAQNEPQHSATAELSGSEVLRSVNIVRRSIVNETTTHIQRLMEKAAAPVVQPTVQKPFKYRTVGGAENMVMLVPPSEMDRFWAADPYMSKLPPIELKEPQKPQPEQEGTTRKTTVNNRPVIVGSTDSSIDSLSREDLSRLADKVYERIETKLTRERRRMGL
ncbi:unknown [Eubacterium sp. CAG:786]|nr:unknown [Eubacterium sp. CAG:786]